MPAHLRNDCAECRLMPWISVTKRPTHSAVSWARHQESRQSFRNDTRERTPLARLKPLCGSGDHGEPGVANGQRGLHSAVMTAPRHCADSARCEARSLDPERMVETRSIVLPGNRRGQLNHLLRAKVLAQLGEQLVWNFDGRFRHRDGIAQHELLQHGKRRTRFKVGQVEKLLLADPLASAHGRTDVNSERTPHQRRCLDGGQALE